MSCLFDYPLRSIYTKRGSALLAALVLVATVAVAEHLRAGEARLALTPSRAHVAATATTALGHHQANQPSPKAKSSLRTAEGRSERSFRIAVISDLNSSYGSVTYGPAVHDAARALVATIRPELVLITGDMVAGQKAQLDYGAMWQAFHSTVTEPLLTAGIVVAPTPGNHDASPGAAFAKERAEYAQQWTLAERVPAVRFVDRERYPFYYSFEYGGVFFASLDAATVGPLAREQREWLEAQLIESGHPTKIVFGHLPIHPFAIQREREILNDPALAELLTRHAVSAYISGHHHAYYPGAVDGVRHIAMPCLGGGARRLIGDRRVSPPALVVLDIHAGLVQSLDAVRGSDFDQVVARHTLPQQIQLGRHRVVRDDIAGLALLPSVLNRSQASPSVLSVVP